MLEGLLWSRVVAAAAAVALPARVRIIAKDVLGAPEQLVLRAARARACESSRGGRAHSCVSYLTNMSAT